MSAESSAGIRSARGYATADTVDAFRNVRNRHLAPRGTVTADLFCPRAAVASGLPDAAQIFRPHLAAAGVLGGAAVAVQVSLRDNWLGGPAFFVYFVLVAFRVGRGQVSLRSRSRECGNEFS